MCLITRLTAQTSHTSIHEIGRSKLSYAANSILAQGKST